jgi:hypothetical protein
MLPDSSTFESIQLSNIAVRLADVTTTPASGVGIALTHARRSLQLLGTLVVPRMKQPFISAARLARDFAILLQGHCFYIYPHTTPPTSSLPGARKTVFSVSTPIPRKYHKLLPRPSSHVPVTTYLPLSVASILHLITPASTVSAASSTPNNGSDPHHPPQLRRPAHRVITENKPKPLTLRTPTSHHSRHGQNISRHCQANANFIPREPFLHIPC